MPDPENSGSEVTSSETVSLEAKPLNRQQVVDALKFGVNRLTQAVNTRRDIPHELQLEQRRVQASIIDAENNANIDDPICKGTFDNTFPSTRPGESITLKEGVPVEKLIKFLEEEAATENDDEEKNKLRDAINALEKSSKTFKELHGEDPELLKARIRQESYFISLRDDPTKTDSLDEDWYLAEKTINERRELVLPEETDDSLAPDPQSAGESATTETGIKTATTAEGETETDSSPDSQTQFEIDIINVQEAIDKLAGIEARKRVAEFLREGRWFNVFRWPAKIGVRLGEGGAVQMVTERIRRGMIDNNTSLMRADAMGRALGQLSEARTQAQAEQQAQVARFKAGNIEEAAREERVTITGGLKKEIINGILLPIDQGTFTTPEQVRAALAEFVRNHPDDAQVQALFGPNASDFGGRAEYFATDILEMGLKIRESRILREPSNEQIDAAIKINFGIAREAHNTDTRTITDRLAAAARRRNVRGGPGAVRVANAALGATLLNPVVVAAASSLGVNGALRAAGWTARAADIPSLLTGVGFGAVITGARRGVESGRDNQTHRAERTLGEQIEARQHSNNPLGRFIERLSGGYRREDLEKFRYDAARAADLINGGGNELIGNKDNPSVRRSVAELRSLDLANPANREAVASRIAEIQTRLTRGQRERRDLIEYTRREIVNQEKNQLYQVRDQLRQSLENSGISTTEVNDLINRLNVQWNDAIDRDVRDKNQAFAFYRARQVAGAAAFGGAIGLGTGLAARGIVEGAKGIASTTDIDEKLGSAVGGAFNKLGTTIRESTGKLRSNLPNEQVRSGDNTIVAGWFGDETAPQPEGQVIPGVNKETFAQLFDKPGTMDLGEYRLAVDGDNSRILDGVARNASILDSAGNPINAPPLKLTSDGELIFGGSVEKLPEPLREFLTQQGGKFEVMNGAQFNIEDKVKHLVETGQREIFAYGNSTVSVDGSTGTVSMLHYPTNTNVYGIINPDGTFLFDPKNPANANVDWATFEQNMGKEAWGISKESVVTIESPLPPQPVEKPILDYFEEKGMVERGGDRVWHQNETPIRDLQGNLLERYDRSLTKVLGVDGKEMQNYHNIVTTPDGHKQIQVDFSQMRSVLIDNMRGVNVVDQTIDPIYGQVADKIVQMPDGTRQYISFDIAVTPNEAANEAGKVISFNAANHPEIRTGHLYLDLESPEAKALFQVDEHGNPIYNQWGNFQKAYFMEVSQTTRDEAGNVIGRNILSTTAGPGTDNITVNPPPPPPPPPYEALVLDPPAAVKYIPKPGDLISPTPIDFFVPPIPMAPRHPLERLIIIPNPDRPGSYIGITIPPEVEGRPSRLADFIRRKAPGTDRKRGEGYSSEGITTVEPGSWEEGEKILKEIRETFDKSEHIYITLSGAIGDAVITSSYIEGLRRLSESMGGKKITLIVPPNIRELYQPLAENTGYELVVVNRGEEMDKAVQMIQDQGESNSIIFGFDQFRDKPEVESLNNGNLIIHDLFTHSVGLYDRIRTTSEDRFSKFFSDLMSAPEGTRYEAPFRLDLPPNKDEIYAEFIRKYGIDTSKKQLAILIESSAIEKRYSIRQWREVINQIKAADPDIEINIIFNPQSKGGHYSDREVNSVFGGLTGTHLIEGRLSELAVLMSQQDMVLGNDTGLTHISAMVENGPQRVLSIHHPDHQPNIWLTTTRHEGIISDSYTNSSKLPDSEGDKDINDIPPSEIANRALSVLNTVIQRLSATPSPTEGSTDRESAFERLRRTASRGANAVRDRTRKPDTTPSEEERLDPLMESAIESLVDRHGLSREEAIAWIRSGGAPS